MYRRCLIKVSGEALAGQRSFGIDPEKTAWIATEIARGARKGAQIGIVIGGGNILRGVNASSVGVDPLIGDSMGMIATVLNGMALRSAIYRAGIEARLLCAFQVGAMVEVFDQERARSYLEEGKILIFAGGTGNPCFTTDSAAALRAVQIQAEVMIKATQVDGVYDKDPKKFSDAIRFDSITPQEVLERRLKVIDAASIEILRRVQMPVMVMNLHVQGNIEKAVSGQKIGTTVA
ncbi:MAG: UMP kinase [Desulfomonilaceae bacterium]